MWNSVRNRLWTTVYWCLWRAVYLCRPRTVYHRICRRLSNKLWTAMFNCPRHNLRKLMYDCRRRKMWNSIHDQIRGTMYHRRWTGMKIIVKSITWNKLENPRKNWHIKWLMFLLIHTYILSRNQNYDKISRLIWLALINRTSTLCHRLLRILTRLL